MRQIQTVRLSKSILGLAGYGWGRGQGKGLWYLMDKLTRLLVKSDIQCGILNGRYRSRNHCIELGVENRGIGPACMKKINPVG